MKEKLLPLLLIFVAVALFCCCGQPSKTQEQSTDQQGEQQSFAIKDPPLPGVRAGNAGEEAASDSTVAATTGNQPPTVTSAKFVGTPGGGLKLDVATQDPEDDPVTVQYAWFVNGEQVSTGQSIPPGKRGDSVSVDLTISDQWHDPVTQSISTIVQGIPPTVTRNEDLRIDNNGKLTYQIMAKDPGGEPLSYSLVKSPNGMSIDAKGLITWDTRNVPNGQYPVTVQVNNANASTNYTFQVNLKK